MVYINDNLDSVLSALGEQLHAADRQAHLVVIGGSGLLAIGVIERPTRDVDVVAVMRDGALVSADPLPVAVVEAARLVARDFRLEPDWLNAGPAGMLEQGELPEGFVGRLVRRDYGPGLTVDFASRLDQIQLKLDAYVSRHEPRDEADLRDLAPTRGELEQAAHSVRALYVPGAIDEALDAAMIDLGGGDARLDA